MKLTDSQFDELQNKLENISPDDISRTYTGKTLAGVSIECIRQRKAKSLRKLRAMPEVRMLRAEQRIENDLHFSSRYYGEAYYIDQKKIHEILQRGSYLSYGQRQAILQDCKLQAALENCPEYQALTELERISAEQEGQRLCTPAPFCGKSRCLWER